MSLFRKMRVLMGALVHKPFMPRPEKVDLDGEPDAPAHTADRRAESPLEVQKPEVNDTERVADLIARQKRETAD